MAKKLKLNGIDEEVPILNKDGKIDSSQYESGVSQEEFDSLSNRVSILEGYTAEDMAFAKHYQAIIDSTNSMTGAFPSDFFTINAGESGFDKITTNWNFLKLLDVSNVTSFEFAFLGASTLTNLSGLANWNVSKSTSFQSIFMNCASLSDGSGIENWVINSNILAGFFTNCSNLKIANVDILKATTSANISALCYNCVLLESLTLKCSQFIEVNSFFTPLDNVPTSCKIYVPNEFVSAYQSGVIWSDYNIIGY